MGDITIIIPRDFNNLYKQYKDFAEYTKQTIIDVLKEEGALTCREAMIWSPPLDGKGGGKGDKKIAEKWGNWAVERDVHSFVTPKNKILSLNLNTQSEFNKWKNTVIPSLDRSDSIIAKIRRDVNVKRAYQAAKNLLAGKPQVKFEVLATESQLRAKHDQLRGQYRGRIRKNNGPRLMQPFIGDDKMITAYIKQRQEKVGWMKAGWHDAIKKIGPPTINGVPKNFGIKDLNQFITRHINSNGFTSLDIGMTNNGKVYFTVKNEVGNIFRVSELAQTEQKVIQARSGKMSARMYYLIDAAIDKTNKGIKPT
jgi:hypothetical protein